MRGGGPVGVGSQVVAPAVDSVLPVPQRGIDVFGGRGREQAVVEDGGIQRLEDHCGSTGLAGLERDCRGESGAGADSGEDDPGRVDPQVVVAGDPGQGVEGVVERCGEGVFRSESIVDGDHHRVQARGEADGTRTSVVASPKTNPPPWK